MPRQNRRRPDIARGGGGSSSSGERRESFRGVEYSVRAVTGASAGREYRCPGCDQVVAAGVPHVVAWPADDLDASDRRHWHTPCWAARERRAPGVQRTRNAPRY
ncbi:MAG: ATP/GTP-binding protein [Jatrophihabitans sp.]|uniref:ATP/GTP-binding protein n=1 Tax=Jatrophihabitans sp. TaxID=1932789 RepID=UPI003F7DB357